MTGFQFIDSHHQQPMQAEFQRVFGGEWSVEDPEEAHKQTLTLNGRNGAGSEIDHAAVLKLTDKFNLGYNSESHGVEVFMHEPQLAPLLEFMRGMPSHQAAEAVVTPKSEPVAVIAPAPQPVASSAKPVLAKRDFKGHLQRYLDYPAPAQGALRAFDLPEISFDPLAEEARYADALQKITGARWQLNSLSHGKQPMVQAISVSGPLSEAQEQALNRLAATMQIRPEALQRGVVMYFPAERLDEVLTLAENQTPMPTGAVGRIQAILEKTPAADYATKAKSDNTGFVKR